MNSISNTLFSEVQTALPFLLMALFWPWYVVNISRHCASAWSLRRIFGRMFSSLWFGVFSAILFIWPKSCSLCSALDIRLVWYIKVTNICKLEKLYFSLIQLLPKHSVAYSQKPLWIIVQQKRLKKKPTLSGKDHNGKCSKSACPGTRTRYSKTWRCGQRVRKLTGQSLQGSTKWKPSQLMCTFMFVSQLV